MMEQEHVRESIITHRGTKVDMVEQADGTIACYMDDEIQSSESDEALYHEALVVPVMEAAKKRSRVMIVGGGEGATAGAGGFTTATTSFPRFFSFRRRGTSRMIKLT